MRASHNSTISKITPGGAVPADAPTAVGAGILVAVIDLLAVALTVWFYLRNPTDASSLQISLAFALFPLAGAVMIARQPRNPVGWLAVALGGTNVAGNLLTRYAAFALVYQPGKLPFGAEAAWVSAWLWTGAFYLISPLILLMPNGHAPSPRWRPALWSGLLITLPVTLAVMALTFPFRGPLLLAPDAGLNQTGPGGVLFLRLITYWQPLMILAILLAVAGLLWRFLHARGIERQQLKWILLACITVPVGLAVNNLLIGDSTDPLLLALGQALNLFSIVAFPVAFAFAVTRYRLYDIDVIIRRTLVYSFVTFLLALCYFASVILIQSALTALTGQASPLAIVISTLISAALFSPVRRRIQAVIDRRFYRRKYNAGLMLERFAATQRELVDLEQFQRQLLRVVDESLQPEFIELGVFVTEHRRE